MVRPGHARHRSAAAWVAELVSIAVVSTETVAHLGRTERRTAERRASVKLHSTRVHVRAHRRDAGGCEPPTHEGRPVKCTMCRE